MPVYGLAKLDHATQYAPCRCLGVAAGSIYVLLSRTRVETVSDDLTRRAYANSPAPTVYPVRYILMFLYPYLYRYSETHRKDTHECYAGVTVLVASHFSDAIVARG